MKKIVYFMLTLMLLGAAGANAQVIMGSWDGDIPPEPHPGAILDLESVEQTPYKGKGLLLPVVKLTNINYFELSEDEEAAEGMIVYNTGSTLEDGIYLWTKESGQAGKWVIIAEVTK